MAPRYLALFTHHPFDTDRMIATICQDTDLRLVHQHGTLIVMASPDAPVLKVDDGSAIMIGHLFCSDGPAQVVTDLDPATGGSIRRTRGQVLIDRFWGGYIALLPSPDGKVLDVIRDPSGAMPCYYTAKLAGPGRAVASDLETLARAKLISSCVDWEALRRHLIAYELRTQTTCIKDVLEVTAGQRLSLSDGADVSANCWLPRTFAARPDASSFEEISSRLKDLTTRVTQGWRSAFTHPLLGVSGGLDSSILAGVLADGQGPMSYFTMATADADGDERTYVRALAEPLGLRIHEWFYTLDHVDITRPTSAHLPRPLLCAFGQSEHRQKLTLADQEGIDAFFLGVGGDNVFCNLMSASPLLDRLYHEGSSAGTWQTGRDICRLTGCSAIELIVAAIKKSAQRGHYRWQTEANFILASPEPQPLLAHSWLTDGPAVPPGKLAHIAMLTRIQGTIDGFSRYTSPLMVLPLLSQPLVEYCLSVPTWRWIEDGRNRAPARRAFSDILPKVVIDRRSKGTPNSFAFEVIDRSKAVARAQLLDGKLAAHGLIDTDRLSHVLADNVPMRGFDHMRIAMLLEAEAWARAIG